MLLISLVFEIIIKVSLAQIILQLFLFEDRWIIREVFVIVLGDDARSL